MPRLVVTALVVLLGLGVPATAAGPDKPTPPPRELGYVPGELIVAFRPGVSADARASVLRARGALALDAPAPAGAALARLPAGASVPLAAAALERDPRVLYAEPNFRYEAAKTPNDPRFPEQWALDQGSAPDIDAPAAWDVQTGSADVVVAVIDTGVAYDHPDLAPNVWTNAGEIPDNGIDDDGNGYVDDVRGWDFVDDDPAPLDFHGHGTHVAATVGAKGDNALGVAGVAWDVSLMALRAGDATGWFAAADIAAAIAYACANGARVVNGSFGGPTSSTTVANAVTSAACADTLFVFAAGNDGVNLDGNAANAFPCELHRPPANGGVSAANVLCVAATTSTDARASFSNYGAAAVHLAAPGASILSAVPGSAMVPGSADGFEGTDEEFDLRWGDRSSNPGDELWGRTQLVKRSGAYSLADSPGEDVDYAPDSDTSILRLGPLDLSGRTGCRFSYWLRARLESEYDYLLVWAGTTDTTSDLAGEFTGSTFGQFQPRSDDLTFLDGEPVAYLRLNLTSDESVQEDGVYLDDLEVRCLAAGTEDYASLSGTSMAAPHVAGVAALLVAEYPALTVAQLRKGILGGADPVPGLAGIVATGGRLNAAGALDDAPRPETSILSGPSGHVASRAASFSFAADRPGTFECRLNGADFEPCEPPRAYADLAQGSHTFRVRALSEEGTPDASPAARTWIVDTVKPKTTITGGPKGTVKAKKATFTFRANEAGVTFQCKLDRKAFQACKSSRKYAKLARGKHVFQVRAKDRAGNVGPVAKRAWKVR